MRITFSQKWIDGICFITDGDCEVFQLGHVFSDMDRIIDRALTLLDARSQADAGPRQVGDVHIHNENKFDFAGAKFTPDFDLEGLMRQIDKRIEAKSVEAAKSAIGNRRT